MTTAEPEKDASVFEEIESLTQEMESFKVLKAEAEAKVLELRAGEDIKAGKVFPREIFECQQEKLRLETEIELRRRKINRLRLSIDPSGFLH